MEEGEEREGKNIRRESGRTRRGKKERKNKNSEGRETKVKGRKYIGQAKENKMITDRE